MKTGLLIKLALLLFMFMLTLPLSAQADQLYEYTYTSGPLSYDIGPDFPLPPSSYSITVSFTYGAISFSPSSFSNNDFINLTGHVSNFKISDGPVTFTTPAVIEFGYNPTPSPVTSSPAPGYLPPGSWAVVSYGSTANCGDFQFLVQGEESGVLYPEWGFSNAGDASQEAAEGLLDDNAYGGEGTWTVTPVPEPSSIILLVLGCLGLAPAVRAVHTKHDEAG